MKDQNQKIESIISTLHRISAEEESVRKYINTTRYQTDLLQNLDIWNQICSSLDTTGDTTLSIEEYLVSDYPENDGLKYIYTYGLLQSLFIQQEAVKHLSEAFEVDFKINDQLKKVRAIRNASIGHPTKNRVRGTVFYNYISRITLSKFGFTLLRSSKGDRDEFIDVDLLSIFTAQVNEIEKSYKLISTKLIEADKMHREKYKNKLIVDIFHSSIGYQFSKIAEGIYSTSTPHHRSFGLKMLESVEKTYLEFENALKERNELNDYIEHDLEQYKHAITILKSFLTEENENMTERDARIYLFYIREKHVHFVEVAKEVDEEYTKKV
ncbi:hypothetical protein [Desulfosudis oleivorans]|uniref:Uncharacterized protein n=1 Tax=Desulfosudis oleivorans (strain DSM 6200 / JCM 39069 / Hxd3) TaxID=96561 RepID=A8ZXF6_DESOH|nr:hypothetical protein [Desulfosudis oleivorans]ABW68535.1 conserved hypothetical protein [Desulfosudis oleivorans Hxd3]